MTTHLLVSALWPGPKDFGPAAAALAPFLGLHQSDAASELKRSRGLLSVALNADAAAAACAAMTQAGHPWHAVPAGLAPALPTALTARGVDPRDPERLTAPVRMTGAPESALWRQVLAAVPATWVNRSEQRVGPKPKKRSAAKVMMSVATTGGIDLLFAKQPRASDGALEVTDAATPMLVLIIAGGPDGGLRRLHVFANRCDYRVLQSPSSNVSMNWQLLLGEVADRLRPDLAGMDLLRAAAAGKAAPGWLTLMDNNDLGRSVRWLMCTAALRRMGRL